MSSNDNDSYQPAEAIMERLGWHVRPGFLERELEGLWGLYNFDPKSTYAAFAAIEKIAAASYMAGEPDYQSKVEVPWWVIKALGLNWTNYLMDAKGQTLGQAFGLEAKGQGGRRVVERHRKRMDDLMIVLEVIDLKESEPPQDGIKLTLEKAIIIVAANRNIAEDTIKGMWKRHHKFVSARLQKLRQQHSPLDPR